MTAIRNHLLALPIGCALALSCAVTAFSQDDYTPTALADFFVKSADLGVNRGICIGTEQECAPQAEPVGKDMLVNFDLASATLTDEAQLSLDVFVEALKDERLAAANFVIEGHTDARGSEAYNDDLANRRAASVRAYIASKGIPENKLVAVGMGESTPRVPDPYAAINRRVEMRVSLR